MVDPSGTPPSGVNFVKAPYEFVVIKRGAVRGIYPSWDAATRATQAMPLCSTVQIDE